MRYDHDSHRRSECAVLPSPNYGEVIRTLTLSSLGFTSYENESPCGVKSHEHNPEA